MKDLYTEHATVAALSDEEVAKLRAVRATVVEGSTLKPVLQFGQAGAQQTVALLLFSCSHPGNVTLERCWICLGTTCRHHCDGPGTVNTWQHPEGLTRDLLPTGFSADLLHVTRDFAVRSPIQMETWPVACAGRDVIGVAATGSGKTLAFGLPALAHTQAQLAAGVAQGAGDT